MIYEFRVFEKLDVIGNSHMFHGHQSQFWRFQYNETAADLLPGFAINW